jgi:hypothetical protein
MIHTLSSLLLPLQPQHSSNSPTISTYHACSSLTYSSLSSISLITSCGYSICKTFLSYIYSIIMSTPSFPQLPCATSKLSCSIVSNLSITYWTSFLLLSFHALFWSNTTSTNTHFCFSISLLSRHHDFTSFYSKSTLYFSVCL